MKSETFPDRLQGTDGIRGKVGLSSEFPGMDPFSVWIQKKILTEEFFELYTFSFCRNLIESGWASPGELMMVGWDTRDPEGNFSDAAIRGIRKSGLNAVVLGVLPTPAVALYQLSQEVLGAFVLTASHNPAEQNGIKIFLGHTGFKLFPEDDKRLTAAILSTDFMHLKEAPQKGGVIDEEASARQFFLHILLDSFNSWITDRSLQQITLIIDAANGAFAPLLEDLTQDLGGARVIVCNTSPEDGINHNCGVADLEGRHTIEAQDLQQEPLCRAEALKRILVEGRRRGAEANNKGITVGLVLDGDGDRCFMPVYDPQEDRIVIIDGDGLAILQLLWLKKNQKCRAGQIYVNTVESTLEASRSAIEAGCSVNQCAVGDKWILWDALLNSYKWRKDFYRTHIDDPEFVQILQELEQLFKIMEQKSSFNALELSLKIKKMDGFFKDRIRDQKILDKFFKQSTFQGASDFLIGNEESGHLLNLTRIPDINGRMIPAYAGNGMKTGLNSLAALESLRPSNPKMLVEWLNEQLPKGYSRSLPVYHVKQKLLEPESGLRNELQTLIEQVLEAEGFSIDWHHRPQEPSMLFGMSLKENLPELCIFVRNSGTEDKLSLYLRGLSNNQELLEKIEKPIYRFLLKNFKDPSKSPVKLERSILNQLMQGPLSFDEIQRSLESDTSFHEIFRLMHSRQPLVRFRDDRWELSEWGHSLLQ